ncbi:MAG: glycosyltransferase family 39 protein [bacterium]|nr:glycosyltransferase family 39 protein [bacterium]
MRPQRLLLLILGLALTLRLAVALRPAGPLFADMRDYHLHALRLAADGSFGPPVRPPLYPLMLSLVYRVAGPRPAAARAVQALLGTCLCLLVWATGSRLGGARIAAAAAAAVACYPSLVIYTALLMSENLFIPILAAAVLLLLAGSRRPAACLAAGVLIGLGTLTRSVLAAFPLAAAGWLIARGERREALLCLFGALLVVAPWSCRASRHHGRFVLVDTFSGYNFLVGNNPRATGRQYLPYADAPVQRPDGAPPDDAAVSAEGYRAGLRFIARNPACFLLLGARKVGYLYGPEIRELAWGYSRGAFGPLPRRVLVPVAAATVAAFPVLCVLALAGLLLRGTPPDRSGGRGLLLLVVAYFTAAHFLTFGESRFHLPFVPALCLLAALLVLRPAAGGRRRRPLLFAILVLLLSLNWTLRLAEDGGRLTAALGPGGDTSEIDY